MNLGNHEYHTLYRKIQINKELQNLGNDEHHSIPENSD